jgi:glucose-6-phosphate 1-epimerase
MLKISNVGTNSSNWNRTSMIRKVQNPKSQGNAHPPPPPPPLHNNIHLAMSAAKDPIDIVHSKSGAKCTMHPFGAQLTSYVTSSGDELLFLSRDAILDGSRPIRGGVPLCFPQFGQPDKSMPQHGFLRNNYWTEVRASRFDDDECAGVSMELSLVDAVNARGGAWGDDTKYDVRCTYTVKINGEGFETNIVVDNLGEEAFRFQVLLHNYFLVRDGAALNGDACNVRGLGGYSVHDKVSGEKHVLGTDNDTVTVPGERIIDREYTPPLGVVDLDLSISAGPSKNLSLKARGMVDGIPVPVSGVVWNPHRDSAKAMIDFGDDQYLDMICVEPGLLTDVPPLGSGKVASFTQFVRCL